MGFSHPGQAGAHRFAPEAIVSQGDEPELAAYPRRYLLADYQSVVASRTRVGLGGLPSSYQNPSPGGNLGVSRVQAAEAC